MTTDIMTANIMTADFMTANIMYHDCRFHDYRFHDSRYDDRSFPLNSINDSLVCQMIWLHQSGEVNILPQILRQNINCPLITPSITLTVICSPLTTTWPTGERHKLLICTRWLQGIMVMEVSVLILGKTAYKTSYNSVQWNVYCVFGLVNSTFENIIPCHGKKCIWLIITRNGRLHHISISSLNMSTDTKAVYKRSILVNSVIIDCWRPNDGCPMICIVGESEKSGSLL